MVLKIVIAEEMLEQESDKNSNVKKIALYWSFKKKKKSFSKNEGKKKKKLAS